MIEYDNFRIEDIDILLNKDCLPERYFSLIPHKGAIEQSLKARGIDDKYQCLALEDLEFAFLTETDTTRAQLFRAFLHLYDYRDRKLSGIGDVSPVFLSTLAERGIKTSSGYLKICLAEGVAAVAAKCGAEYGEAEKLLSYCDLMRLPGVKFVRAGLYYRAGYVNIGAFRDKSAGKIREVTAQTIAQSGLPLAVPMLKELKTQIAVARVLPEIYEKSLGVRE